MMTEQWLSSLLFVLKGFSISFFTLQFPITKNSIRNYDKTYFFQISLLENQLNDVNMRQSDVVDEDSGMYFKHQPLVTEPQLEGKRGSLSHNFFPFVPVQSSASKSVVGELVT